MLKVVQLLQKTMGALQLLKSQFVCHLVICYVFLFSGLVINLLQLCTLPLWLVDKQLARRINVRLGYCISSRKYWLATLKSGGGTGWTHCCNKYNQGPKNTDRSA